MTLVIQSTTERYVFTISPQGPEGSWSTFTLITEHLNGDRDRSIHRSLLAAKRAAREWLGTDAKPWPKGGTS